MDFENDEPINLVEVKPEITKQDPIEQVFLMNQKMQGR